ncbi:MAG: YihA family ribosome biogenesis GTP-binding protein [Xanthomonadales bacterium]|nr:YihA family ribosome biogenesis GTP-binding protein [Xanthomonadales bacterium]
MNHVPPPPDPAVLARRPLQYASYLKSVHNWRDLPDEGGLEVAIAGRSNAGKSSAINAMAEQTRLARTSKTPGRTQQLVFFDLAPERYLVDLPGYGYAKVPEALRDHWRKLIERYFRERQSLCGLIVVMDCRHPLKDFDRSMIGFAAERGLPCHVLLTKADKLGRGAQSATLASVRKQLKTMVGERAGVQTFSAITRHGVDQARAVIAHWLCFAAPPDQPAGKEATS